MWWLFILLLWWLAGTTIFLCNVQYPCYSLWYLPLNMGATSCYFFHITGVFESQRYVTGVLLFLCCQNFSRLSRSTCSCLSEAVLLVVGGVSLQFWQSVVWFDGADGRAYALSNRLEHLVIALTKAAFGQLLRRWSKDPLPEQRVQERHSYLRHAGHRRQLGQDAMGICIILHAPISSWIRWCLSLPWALPKWIKVEKKANI